MDAKNELRDKIENAFDAHLWECDGKIFNLVSGFLRRYPERFDESAQAANILLVDRLGEPGINKPLYFMGILLLACARIAIIKESSSEDFTHILEPLRVCELLVSYPDEKKPVQDVIMACQWNVSIRRSLNSDVVWDLIQQFTDPDKKPNSESIFVPIINEDTGKGILVELIVDFLPGWGSGCLVYENPRHMLFQDIEESMEDSFTRAANYVHKSLEIKKPVNFRWRFKIPFSGFDSKLPLKGESASAAFALCTAKLLSCQFEENVSMAG